MKCILTITSIILVFSIHTNMGDELKNQMAKQENNCMKLDDIFIPAKFKKIIMEAKWKYQRFKLQQDCQKKVGLDSESLKNITHECFVDASNKETAEFVTCVAIGAGFIDGEGNLQYDRIISHLKGVGVNGSFIEEMDEECSKIQKIDDKPLLTMKYYKCYAKYLPREFLVL